MDATEVVMDMMEAATDTTEAAMDMREAVAPLVILGEAVNAASRNVHRQQQVFIHSQQCALPQTGGDGT